MVFPTGAFIDDPDQLLFPCTTGPPQNWGRSTHPAIDDLYARQARSLDPAERRSVVHWTKMRNWIAPPSHFTNQKLQDVCLAED